MTGGRRQSRSGGGGQAQIIILAVGLVLAILAPIAAQLLYFAISRKREYLADASSALYTRYPEGLASALEKLATSETQLKTANKAMAPMYTINPFRKKDTPLEDLSSTHPPIAERIRILRSMAGASLADYDQSYRQVKGTGVVPASALAGAAAIPLRAASPLAGVEEKAPERIERARTTSDLMWRLSNYQTIDCDCGTRLKVPPNFRGTSIRCPHCGRTHQVR
jgi:heat shock protein HtpX